MVRTKDISYEYIPNIKSKCLTMQPMVKASQHGLYAMYTAPLLKYTTTSYKTLESSATPLS